MAQYYTLVTNKGTEKISSIIATGSKLNLTKFKVGDGGGSYYEPSVKQTALKNVKYEGDINSIKIETITVKEVEKKVIKIEGIIPTDIGGFYIREVGLFDDSGDLIAIGKYCETYKPTADEGTAKEIIIRLVIDVENVESIDLSVNANLSIVTRDELDAELEIVRSDIIKAQIPYKVTEGSDNAYICNLEDITEYTKGLAICIEPHADSTGASTLNINDIGAIEIKDGNGNSITAGGLKTGIPYNLRYNGVNFILQGKGGGGNATPDKLLEGYKATVDSGQIVGTMRNVTGTIQGSSASDAFTNNAITGVASNSYVGAFDYAGVNGYVENLRVHITNLLAGNIKAGVKVGGEKGYIQGTFTSDANAQAGHILSGYSAYVNANKINGNIPVLTGIRNATGVARWSDNGLAVYPERGYQKGGAGDGEIKVSQAQLINTYGITANKIVSGQEIAGVWGTAITGALYNNGTINHVSGTSNTITLPFSPVCIYIYYKRRSNSAEIHYIICTPVNTVGFELSPGSGTTTYFKCSGTTLTVSSSLSDGTVIYKAYA